MPTVQPFEGSAPFNQFSSSKLLTDIATYQRRRKWTSKCWRAAVGYVYIPHTISDQLSNLVRRETLNSTEACTLLVDTRLPNTDCRSVELRIHRKILAYAFEAHRPRNHKNSTSCTEMNATTWAGANFKISPSSSAACDVTSLLETDGQSYAEARISILGQLPGCKLRLRSHPVNEKASTVRSVPHSLSPAAHASAVTSAVTPVTRTAGRPALATTPPSAACILFQSSAS